MPSHGLKDTVYLLPSESVKLSVTWPEAPREAGLVPALPAARARVRVMERKAATPMRRTPKIQLKALRGMNPVR
jgi:hypothetical protein